jgi:hypothetical protein
MQSRSFPLMACFLAGCLAMPGLASAEIVKIAGTWTAQAIGSACKSAGGTFVPHADGQGYGCDKKNCDGKGGTCRVSCDTAGQCNGSTPDRRVSGLAQPRATVGGVLDNWGIVQGPATQGAVSTPPRGVLSP